MKSTSTKDLLKKIIREEVRRAVKEELASLQLEDYNQTVQEVSQPQYSSTKLVNTFASSNPLEEMLRETRNSMSPDEYRNIVSADSSMIQKPNFASSQARQMGISGNEPGLDLSQLDFVKNAKAVLDLANEKSKNK